MGRETGTFSRLVALIATMCMMVCTPACAQREQGTSTTWDPRSAAAYLDQRENWWIHWRGAGRDHGTFCVSCHTVAPYVLARGRLDAGVDRTISSPAEQAILADVEKRVGLWNETSPFYSNSLLEPDKSMESRGSESVLNALILVARDAQLEQLSPIARHALQIMWSQQITRGAAAGAWSWLNFNLAPWESADAQYYGATLAALAVGMAPGDYRSDPDIRDNLRSLRDYLARDYSSQSLEHRLVLLWASTKLPDLLSTERRSAIIAAALDAQRPDGGWSLSDLAMHPTLRGRLGALLSRPTSDGYATALATLALQDAEPGPDDPQVQRGLSWLTHHQQARGFWVTYSLNKRRPLTNPIGEFMSDAATAYAVLALTEKGSSKAQIARGAK